MKNNYRVVLYLCILVSAYSLAKEYIPVFSHGFADTGWQKNNYVKEYTWLGMKYKNERYILNEPVKTFDYPDVVYKKLVNIFKTSFGQDNEIAELKKNCDEVVPEKSEDAAILLFGLSRGGSTAINYVVTEDPQQVEVLVLESPVGHAKNVFNHHWFIKFIAKMLWTKPDGIYNFFEKISVHDANGKHAVDLVDKIRKDIPVMFICSQEDQSVPVDSTIELYEKLKAAGHEKAYLLKLQKGRHSKLLFSEDADKYQNVMHAFYKKHGLPCDDELAEKGQAFFEQCQPEVGSAAQGG